MKVKIEPEELKIALDEVLKNTPTGAYVYLENETSYVSIRSIDAHGKMIEARVYDVGTQLLPTITQTRKILRKK